MDLPVLLDWMDDRDQPVLEGYLGLWDRRVRGVKLERLEPEEHSVLLALRDQRGLAHQAHQVVGD